MGVVDVSRRKTSAVEVHADDAGLFVLEVRRPVIKILAVDFAPEIDRVLPTEVVMFVCSPRDIEVGSTAATRTGTVKEHLMPVGREIGRSSIGATDADAAFAVDDRAQIDWRLPGGIEAGAF